MNQAFQKIFLTTLVLIIPFFYMDIYPTSGDILARFNLGVMHSNNLVQSLEVYPKYWPPLYPALLWAMDKTVGISAHLINVLFFSITLLLVALFTRNYIDKKYYFIPAALLAVNNVFYYNASVISSELLMLALTMLLILLLARHTEKPETKYAFFLGLLTGVICFTRYFGLIWVFPTTALCLILVNSSTRNKLGNILIYGATSFLVSASWLFYVYAKTGYLTGQDRTGERNIPDNLAHWISLVELDHNLLFTLKTATYDLLSPYYVGATKVVVMTKLSIYEVFLSLIILLVFIFSLAHIFQFLKTRNIFEEFKPKYIPAIFSLSYILITILVWTLGNNDPIYTRFIFPMYPFFVMSAFAVFADANGPDLSQRFVRYSLLVISVIYMNNQLMEFSSLVAARPS